MNIVLAADGRMAINGEVCDLARLEQIIRAEATKDSELRAVIAADQSVDYGDVMALIDLVKAEGVKSFALNIDHS